MYLLLKHLASPTWFSELDKQIESVMTFDQKDQAMPDDMTLHACFNWNEEIRQVMAKKHTVEYANDESVTIYSQDWGYIAAVVRAGQFYRFVYYAGTREDLFEITPYAVGYRNSHEVKDISEFLDQVDEEVLWYKDNGREDDVFWHETEDDILMCMEPQELTKLIVSELVRGAGVLPKPLQITVNRLAVKGAIDVDIIADYRSLIAVGLRHLSFLKVS